MNLGGKYIKINTNNVKNIICFLYSEGYKWSAYKHDLDYTLEWYYHGNYFNSDGTSYVLFHDENIFVFNDNSASYEYFNIHKYLRDEKLKRILK